MIEEAGRRAFPLAALVSRAGVPPQDVDGRAAALVATKRIDRVSDMLVSRRAVDELKTSLVEMLTAHHRAQPLSEGVPREEARERLFRRGHPAVFERVVDDLVQSGTVAGRDRLSLARHHVALSPGEEQAREAIESALRGGGTDAARPRGHRRAAPAGRGGGRARRSRAGQAEAARQARHARLSRGGAAVAEEPDLRAEGRR